MSTFKYFNENNGDYNQVVAIHPGVTWDLRIEYDETGRPIDAQFAVGACTVPNGDGWESWPGGDCPVRPFVEVEVETALGQRRRGRADDFNWASDLCCPIVKWRLARG